MSKYQPGSSSSICSSICVSAHLCTLVCPWFLLFLFLFLLFLFRFYSFSPSFFFSLSPFTIVSLLFLFLYIKHRVSRHIPVTKTNFYTILCLLLSRFYKLFHDFLLILFLAFSSLTLSFSNEFPYSLIFFSFRTWPFIDGRFRRRQV